MISGCATPAGTRKGIERTPEIHYSVLGKTGLMVSELGFGGYRVDDRVEEHRVALRKALSCGINLIDTSSNYADGHSETLVGSVLEELIQLNQLKREEVVVVTKAGYLQGQNYDLSQKRKLDQDPYPELVEISEGLEHCIHPVFLAEQITHSLNRLGLEKLDVFLLHNPEYYLQWAEKQGRPKSESFRIYYERLRHAFLYLEEEVKRGRISWYGISSNTFGYPAHNLQFTALDQVLECVESLEMDHLGVIQMPLNLYESGPVTEFNQSTGETVLQVARSQNVGVLINRPLNAYRDGQLKRLTDFEWEDTVHETEIYEQLNVLVHLEQEWQTLDWTQSGFTETHLSELRSFFSIGLQLRSYWTEFSGFVHWKEVLSTYILPRVEYGVGQLTSVSDLDAQQLEWLHHYLAHINHITKQISAYYKQRSQDHADRIKLGLQQSDEQFDGMMHLSQMAVNAVRQIEGVSSVLVGMRTESYVSDMVGALIEPVVKKSKPTWVTLF